MTPNLELHIDHLVLPDVPGLDPAAVQAALQQALSQHVAAHGIPPSWQAGVSLGAVSGGKLQGGHALTPQAVGQRLAHSILGGASR